MVLRPGYIRGRIGRVEQKVDKFSVVVRCDVLLIGRRRPDDARMPCVRVRRAQEVQGGDERVHEVGALEVRWETRADLELK